MRGKRWKGKGERKVGWGWSSDVEGEEVDMRGLRKEARVET